MTWGLRRLSLSSTVSGKSSRRLSVSIGHDGFDTSSPPHSPTLSSSPTSSASSSRSSSPAPSAPAVGHLKRTDNNLRRLSHVLTKLATRRSSLRPSSFVETEPPKIVPMVAKFEDIDETPAPCYVELEEVTASRGPKSVRRFCRVEQVDFSLFKETEEVEQHATDKMLQAQQVLLTSEEPAVIIDSASDGSSSEDSLPLARADKSWLKSTLSM